MRYLDVLTRVIGRTGVPWVFIDGNHDNRAHLLAHHPQRDEEGFHVVRPGLGYADRGHRWTWGGMRFLAFGGALSSDKAQRLAVEHDRYLKAVTAERHRRTSGRPAQTVPPVTEWVWFAGEEASAADLERALAGRSVDILLSHDKPLRSRLSVPLRSGPDFERQQRHIQAIVDRYEPALVAHGHHHVRYADRLASTAVVGLAADDLAAGDGWRRENAWMLLEVGEGRVIGDALIPSFG